MEDTTKLLSTRKSSKYYQMLILWCTSVVRVDGILSKEFVVTARVLQGDTLVSFLFVIVLNFVLQKTGRTAGLQIYATE